VLNLCEPKRQVRLLPRRKFINRKVWVRTPHAGSHPPSLWWHTSLAPEQSQRVLLVYLERRAYKFDRETKGSSFDKRWASVCRALEEQAWADTVPHNFSENLHLWLQELTRPDPATGNKRGYWTLEGYALVHKMNPHPFYAWFRAMEKVAKELYPDRVPIGRRNKPPLPEGAIQAIRAEYLQADYSDKEVVQKIAEKHGIEPFRVGQLCRNEKHRRREEMERAQAEHDAANPTQSEPEPSPLDYEE
jgi:hypothetical protein